MKTQNIVIAGLAALALLLIAFIVARPAPQLAGATANPTGQSFYSQPSFLQGAAFGTRSQSFFNNAGLLQLSTTGDQITRLNQGTCYFAPSGTTIAASTTVAIDCQATAAVSASGQHALTGVSSGDAVSLELSTTTAQVNANLQSLVAVGVAASTTQGYITVRLQNLTGTTFTWPTTGSASGTAYYIAAH